MLPSALNLTLLPWVATNPHPHGQCWCSGDIPPHMWNIEYWITPFQYCQYCHSHSHTYLIFVISFTQAFCVVEIFYTQHAWFLTKLNLRQKRVNRWNALCKIIHWQWLCVKSIFIVKSPIQCLITPWNYTVLNICKKHKLFPRSVKKILHLIEKIYTGTACGACDKYEVWSVVVSN